MKRPRRFLLAFAGLVLVGLAAFAATSGYYGGSDGSGCARCHEIRPMVDSWAASTHRNVACQDCHGSSFSADVRMHLKNLQRVWLHSQGETPAQIRLRHQDVAPLLGRCAACHAHEYADWRSGPHGVSYATIFLNEDHNRSQKLMDDCLRCHGMHYEGGIDDLVSPIDREGPWQLLDAVMRDEPVLPCLACHTMHRQGEPFPAWRERTSVFGVKEEIARPSLALHDRRSREPVPVAHLPLPAMKDGERLVRISPDQRQALCYQCHAPLASAQVFSGDDRTPTGVHEGLSCLVCHGHHGQTTRPSCAGCHPQLSNCGIDVEKMDTTFRSLESAHNVHRVACEDCHPKGVPVRRPGAMVARLLDPTDETPPDTKIPASE